VDSRPHSYKNRQLIPATLELFLFILPSSSRRHPCILAVLIFFGSVAVRNLYIALELRQLFLCFRHFGISFHGPAASYSIRSAATRCESTGRLPGRTRNDRRKSMRGAPGGLWDLVLFDRRPAGEMARLGDPAIGQMGASRIEQPGQMAQLRNQRGQPMYWPSSHNSIMRAKMAMEVSNRCACVRPRWDPAAASSRGRAGSGSR